MTIKQSRADFVVEELLEESFRQGISSQPGAYALYELTKEGLTTPEAVGMVGKALRLPPPALALGGLKDKHAHTRQHITAQFNRPGAGPAELAGRNWSIHRVGWVAQPITTSAIHANRFEIVVRDMSAKAAARMETAAELLHPPGSNELLVVNYFGAQRFGTARHGQGFLAKLLVHGKFEEALRLAIATPSRKDRHIDKDFKRLLSKQWGQWEQVVRRLPRCPNRSAVEVLARSGDFLQAFAALPYFIQQMNVEAYQSYLWNMTAAVLIAQKCMDRGETWAVEDLYGDLLFPGAAAVPAELAGLDMPLLSPKTEMVEPWAEAARAVLQREGLTQEQLKIPGLRRPFFGEAPRKLFVMSEGFGMSATEPDERAGKGRLKRAVTFAMPRGCYATILLRAMGQ